MLNLDVGDIFNAIRGFFDGRAHLGYEYSAYYYYARHVAVQPFWIDCVNSKGLEKAALKAIKTFFSLNDHQKEVFVEDSARWHMSLKHKTVGSRPDIYPGEPFPPPRSIQTFYKRQVNALSKKFPGTEYPDFVQLDSVTQNYYIKKFYHETRLYMRRYDMFMKSLTPNDLVSYAVFKARNWERNMYLKETLRRAANEFVFPFCKREVKVEYNERKSLHTKPQKVYRKKKDVKPKKKKKTNNPFCNDAEFMKIAKKLPKSKVAVKKHLKPEISPMSLKLAECQRIIKKYADKNIVVTNKEIKGHKLKRVLMYKKDGYRKRKLARLLRVIQMLKKKAELAGVDIDAPSPEENKNTSDEPQTKNQNTSHESQTENQVGKRKERSNAKKAKTFKLSVVKNRRVIEEPKTNQEPAIIKRIEAMEAKEDCDELSDTEVKFSLYPRAQPQIPSGRKRGKARKNPAGLKLKFISNLSKSLEEWKNRRELIIHRAKKYFYPIQDLLEQEGIKQQPDFKYTYNSSIQTDPVKFVDLSKSYSNVASQAREKKKKFTNRSTMTNIRGQTYNRIGVCLRCKNKDTKAYERKIQMARERRSFRHIKDVHRKKELQRGFGELINMNRYRNVVIKHMLHSTQKVFPRDFRLNTPCRRRLSVVLLKHVKFIRACQVAIQRNPNLDEADEDTVVDAILDAHNWNLRFTPTNREKSEKDVPEIPRNPDGSIAAAPVRKRRSRKVVNVSDTSGPASIVTVSQQNPLSLQLSPPTNKEIARKIPEIDATKTADVAIPAASLSQLENERIETHVSDTSVPLAIVTISEQDPVPLTLSPLPLIVLPPNDSGSLLTTTMSYSPAAPVSTTMPQLQSNPEIESNFEAEFLNIVGILGNVEDASTSSSK